MAFNAAEIVAVLAAHIEGGVVHAELFFQQVFGEAHLGVGFGPVYLAYGFLKVGEGVVYAGVGCGDFDFGAADEFHLVDVVDVDAEFLHPQGGVGHGGIDAEGASAEVGVGLAFQAVGGRYSEDAAAYAGEHGIVGDIAEGFVEGDAYLIERAGVGEHAYQAGVFGVNVGEHEDGLGGELGGHAGVLGPGPHAEVEDDAVDVFGGHALAFAYGYRVLP